jgi:hypothetical protein
MAIESVRSLQSGKSRFVSDFAVTFKQINQIGTSVTPTIGNPNPNGSATQSSPLQAISSNNNLSSTNTLPYTQQNFPSEIQNGNFGAAASGRIADATTNTPAAIGPSTTGEPDYANTNIPVDVGTSFTTNPTYTATLPVLPPIPTMRPFVPSLPLPSVP